jgi:hypothetical protein
MLRLHLFFGAIILQKRESSFNLTACYGSNRYQLSNTTAPCRQAAVILSESPRGTENNI